MTDRSLVQESSLAAALRRMYVQQAQNPNPHGYCPECGAELYPIDSDVLTCRRGHHGVRS